MRVVIVSALVAFIALFYMAENAATALRPDPPPGAKHATILRHWHYTYDAVWTATDGSKIHVRCKRFSDGFRCRIVRIEWAS